MSVQSPDTNVEETSYERARRRMEELKGFYVHLGVYLAVNLGLFLINYLTSRGNWWFYWPLIGWGIAVVIHAFTVFGVERLFGRSWEQRKIQQLMDEEQRHSPGQP